MHVMVFVIITALAITLAPIAVSAYTVDPALITTVQSYIDSSKTQVSQEKWTRALAGLGGISHADPMTAQEAQINAYKFDPNRWNPVVDAMAALQGVTVDKPAALIAAVQDYAAEASVGSKHVDRWNRVLAALGSGTHDNPMTAAEAQEFADRGWKRWVPVVDALTVLESQPTQWEESIEPIPAQSSHREPYQVPQSLITTVQGYTTETNSGAEHVDRWNRVLAAFGVAQHNNPMTAAEAQEFADRFSSARWNPIVAALTALEQSQQPHTREERLAEGKQLLQEIKSMIAEMRQKLDEATAFVNTLDNKPHTYTEALADAELIVVWQEDRTIPGAEEKITGIRINGAYEPSFKQLKDIRDAIRDTHAPKVNKLLAPIFTVKELQQKVQEITIKVAVMREISAEANAMMAEAKEFVKKWDETPTTYADAIEKAERSFRWIKSTNILDKNYQKFLNDPTNPQNIQIMQGLYEKTFLPSFDTLKDDLETLLSTARQQTEKEQCAQAVFCAWHSDDVTVSEYINRIDGIETVIEYYESGDIAKYSQSYPHSTQKEFEIIYYDPYNTRNCFDVQNTADKSDKKIAKEHCRGQIHQTTTWYSNGNIAQETSYHAPSTNGVNRMTADKVLTKDGRTVFNIYLIDFQTQVPNSGLYTYPDNSKKSEYSSGTLTCFEDGTGTDTGAPEPCTPFHTRAQY